MDDEQYRDYLREMMSHLQKTHDTGACPEGVLIVIHGGNESPRRMVDLSLDLVKPIGADGFYPIFINWDSNIRRSYAQQLLRIRAGLYTRWALVSAPFYLIGDVARAAAALLPALGQYFRLLYRSSRFGDYDTMKHLDRFKTADVKAGTWQPDSQAWRAIQAVVSLPVQVFVLLVTLITVPRAWGNLLRRVHAMFRAPREFDRTASPFRGTPDAGTYEPPQGAMAVFLRALTKTVRHCPGMKVTYIAHSMGSMIANEALQYASGLPLASIVYMAPACSVREFEAATAPLLARNRDTEAYVLTLHPRVEAGQRDACGLVGGSVLEWQEGSFMAPNSYLDRTLGRWDNALRTLHIYEPAVLKHLHFKCFSYAGQNPRRPSRHVDFNNPELDPPFWSRQFWT